MNAKPVNDLVPESTKQLILEKTPKQYIKRRQGRGGTTLDYVETGYVISKLNEVFNYLWDFEVLEEKVGHEQVYVRGKLTGHISPELSITKTQYGGSQIKMLANGSTIDIADDLKAAASDCLKKCASMFGIAQDVFWPSGQEESTPETGRIVTPSELNQARQAAPEIEEQEVRTIKATPKQINYIKKLYQEGKITEIATEEYEAWLNGLDLAQASNIIAMATGK